MPESMPTDVEELILRLLLAAPEPMYGLEMVKRSSGDLKRGTVYVTLQRMETKGLVSSKEESVILPHIGIARRLYKVTGHGARALQALEMHRIMMSGGLLPEGA